MFFRNEVDKNRICGMTITDKMTYGELDVFIEEIKAFLPERQLLFLLCSNTLESLAGYVACLTNQVVPLLLSQQLDDVLLGHLISTYKPAFFWMPKEKWEACSVDDSLIQGEIIWTWKEYVLIKHQNVGDVLLYEDLALLLTTSGSTGSPKLVRQSYDNIKANAASIVEYLSIDENERPITTLPMQYTYGLSIINSHLMAGATILLMEHTYTQREFWEFFKKEKATSFGGVPYTYEILKKLRFFRMELPSLRTMTQAGGKLSVELHKEFAEYAMETGRRFFIMYGQTEATARMAYLPCEKTIEKCGSMGIAIPGGAFTLIDVNGEKITEPDVVGELMYKGANVTLGYAECLEDLKKGDERQGVLVTGDMAKMDEDGYFYIVGRKKRFLKIFGNRINLDEIEGMLKSEYQELECACSGRDDLLVVYEVNALKPQALVHFLAEKTKLHPKAFQVKHVSEIPKNEAGKVLYDRLNI